jgi:rRNA maturation protein Nop10
VRPIIPTSTVKLELGKDEGVTTIKACCPGCGEIDLVAGDILLRIGAVRTSNTYGFSCPDCGDFVEKTADDRIIRLLLSGGVMPVPLHIPAEALEIHTGPPLTLDDLLDFHQHLDDDTWFAGLTGL